MGAAVAGPVLSVALQSLRVRVVYRSLMLKSILFKKT